MRRPRRGTSPHDAELMPIDVDVDVEPRISGLRRVAADKDGLSTECERVYVPLTLLTLDSVALVLSEDDNVVKSAEYRFNLLELDAKEDMGKSLKRNMICNVGVCLLAFLCVSVPELLSVEKSGRECVRHVVSEVRQVLTARVRFAGSRSGPTLTLSSPASHRLRLSDPHSSARTWISHQLLLRFVMFALADCCVATFAFSVPGFAFLWQATTWR